MVPWCGVQVGQVYHSTTYHYHNLLGTNAGFINAGFITYILYIHTCLDHRSLRACLRSSGLSLSLTYCSCKLLSRCIQNHVTWHYCFDSDSPPSLPPPPPSPSPAPVLLWKFSYNRNKFLSNMATVTFPTSGTYCTPSMANNAALSTFL